MTEPVIIINGQPLTSAQAMALRVAAASFHQEMGDTNALGDDEAGRQLVKAYRERLYEVLKIMLATSVFISNQQAGDIH